MPFQNVVTLDENQTKSVLNPEELKLINKQPNNTIATHVIVTLDSVGNISLIERDSELIHVEGESMKTADIGKIVSQDGDSVTIKANLISSYSEYFSAINGTLLLLPFDAKTNEELKGTFVENFRIKHDYLPCPLGTKAGEKWTNGAGYALVDIVTQKVVDIVFQDKGVLVDDFATGKILKDKSEFDLLAVTCIMANGGVNFGMLIK